MRHSISPPRDGLCGTPIAPDDPDGLRSLLDRARHDRDEANHRIANSIQSAAAFLRAERRRIGSEDARLALFGAEMRLEGIARIHRYICDRGGNGDVAIRAFLEDFGGGLRHALGVDLSIESDEAMVPTRIATQLAVVMSELVMNAVKHAYENQPGGAIALVCRRQGDMLQMTVSDHGSGLPDGFSVDRAGGGLGMSIVTGAVESIGGTLTARSDGGAVFDVRVPLA